MAKQDAAPALLPANPLKNANRDLEASGLPLACEMRHLILQESVPSSRSNARWSWTCLHYASLLLSVASLLPLIAVGLYVFFFVILIFLGSSDLATTLVTYFVYAFGYPPLIFAFFLTIASFASGEIVYAGKGLTAAEMLSNIVAYYGGSTALLAAPAILIPLSLTMILALGLATVMSHVMEGRDTVDSLTLTKALTFSPESDHASIYLIRDLPKVDGVSQQDYLDKLRGSLERVAVLSDGQCIVGALIAPHWTCATVEPGLRLLTVIHRDIECSLELTLRPGDVAYVRAEVDVTSSNGAAPAVRAFRVQESDRLSRDLSSRSRAMKRADLERLCTCGERQGVDTHPAEEPV